MIYLFWKRGMQAGEYHAIDLNVWDTNNIGYLRITCYTYDNLFVYEIILYWLIIVDSLYTNTHSIINSILNDHILFLK